MDKTRREEVGKIVQEFLSQAETLVPTSKPEPGSPTDQSLEYIRWARNRMGLPPAVQMSTFGMDIWNLAIYGCRGLPIKNPSANMMVGLIVVRLPWDVHRVCCTVTDMDLRPRVRVPVDLWQSTGDQLSFTEKWTDGMGMATFDVERDAVPWLGLTVGTVDGRTSVKDFKIPTN